MHLMLGDRPFFWNSEPMSPHFCCSPLDRTHHRRTSALAGGRWENKKSRWHEGQEKLIYLLSCSPSLSWCCSSWNPSTPWARWTPLPGTWWRNPRRADLLIRIQPKKIIWTLTFAEKRKRHSIKVQRNVCLKMLTYLTYMEKQTAPVLLEKRNQEFGMNIRLGTGLKSICSSLSVFEFYD